MQPDTPTPSGSVLAPRRLARGARRRRDLAALLALALPGSLASADDRALLTQGSAKPYVFFILDTSGSMNWQPGQDTRYAVDSSETRYAFAPASGDDPQSKMYQAKSAIFRVMQDPSLDGIRWGFATYNQDDSRIYRKHWLYTPRTAPSWAANGEDFHYPMPGHGKTFGDRCLDDAGSSGCAFSSSNTQGSCTMSRSLDDSLEALLEAYHFPVTGNDFLATSYQFLNHDGHRYRLEWQRESGSFGDESIEVELTLTRFADCDSDCDGDCGVIPNTNTVWSDDIWFDRTYVTDSQGRALPGDPGYLAWLLESSNPPDPYSYDDTGASGTCEGLETNGGSGSGDDDVAGSYVVKMTTAADPADATRPAPNPTLASRGTPLGRGDFVPLDWKDEAVWTQTTVPAPYRFSNLDYILRRLAPNWNPSDPSSVPDFRSAPYFQNAPDTLAATSTAGNLALKTAYTTTVGGTTYRTPPIFANGSTPIGNSLEDFRVWFDSWKPKAQVACESGGDCKFQCRSTNIVFLTDGDETCFGATVSATNPMSPSQDGGGDWNPCYVADQLWKKGGRNVRTFVVGFGLQDEGNFLGCIADKGGTAKKDYDNDGDLDGPGVILPGSENELVDALTTIFTQIREGSASFASAAVPTVQADAADKVFLTEFTPVGDRSVWPGKFFAFVKPVPLNLARRPDVTKECTADRTSGCFAWEAQEVVVEQQVKGSEAAPIGNGPNQRRVFYAERGTTPEVPARRHYLRPFDAATTDEQKADLWLGLDLLGDCDLDDDGDLVEDLFDADNSDGAACEDEALTARSEEILSTLLALKRVNPPGGSLTEYVIGDNFHSDPLSIGEPNNLRYFVADVGADLAAGTDACVDDAFDDQRAYRRFSIKNRHRRRMLALGTNDGMLHVFDSGVYRWDDNSKTGQFDNGTGRELFAFAPRALLGNFEALYDPLHWDADKGNSTPRPTYGVDGRPVASDVLIDPIHGGWGSLDEPQRCDRRWRTVMVGGLRDGASTLRPEELPLGISASADLVAGGYYALDVTVPDGDIEKKDTSEFMFVPTVTGNDPPSCLGDGEGSGTPADCGPTPFAMPLWEFHDTVDGIRLDEDGNGQIDLARTWSTPNIGRIRVCTDACGGDPVDDVLEDRYVAVFGGGLDIQQPWARGNWLYMVDIETGEAIYKRPVLGAVAGEPAAVDTDLDGYIDRIYAGTLYGFMYRVDLVQDDAATTEVERNYPALSNASVTVTDKNGVVHLRTAPRIVGNEFAPRILFSASATNVNDTVATVLAAPVNARPIFFRPSVVFVPELEKYALAFGTGNREDLSATGQPQQRFFALVDDRAWNQLADDLADTPINLTALQAIDLASAANVHANRNFFLERAAGQKGWYIALGAEERLVTDPVTISGVLVFTVFSPRTNIIAQGVCEETGTSRIFVTLVANAEGLLYTGVSGTPSRFKTVSDLVTQPFAEQSQTKNPPPQPGDTNGDGVVDANDDRELNEGEELLDANMKKVEEKIKAMMPDNCRFLRGYRTDIKTRDSRTGIEWIAPIPLCVVESNFREF